MPIRGVNRPDTKGRPYHVRCYNIAFPEGEATLKDYQGPGSPSQQTRGNDKRTPITQLEDTND